MEIEAKIKAKRGITIYTRQEEKQTEIWNCAKQMNR